MISDINTSITSQERCTPPNSTKDNPYMARLHRDLNSPSASTRLRALKALRSPKNGPYCNFDIPHEEQDIITEEERHAKNQKPKTIQEVMKDVIVYVEVRTGEDNRSDGIKKVISELGARINDKLLRNTTHVVFKDGLLSTYNKAKSWNIPIVSILWIETCKKQVRLVDPKTFTISNIERYENPELYKKIRKHKSMQPNAEDKIRIRKPRVNTPQKSNTNETTTDDTISKIELSAPKDNLPEIFGDFLDKLLANTDNSAECFSKNSELLKVIKTSNFANVKLQSPSARTLVSKSSSVCISSIESELSLSSGETVERKNDNDKTEGVRKSRRISLNGCPNYSELDKGISKTIVPKTPSRQNNRRRTMFTPSFLHSTIDEVEKDTTISMDISLSKNVLKTPIETKGGRRKTMQISTAMHETKNLTRINNKSSCQSTIVDKNTSQEFDFITPPSSIQFCNTSSWKKTDSKMEISNTSRAISTNKKNTVSPMIKSLLRRQTMYTPQMCDFTNCDIESTSKSTHTLDKNVAKTSKKSNLRRTLFTQPIDVNKQMDESKQGNSMEQCDLSAGQDLSFNNTMEAAKDGKKSDDPITINKRKTIGTVLNEYNNSLIFSSTKTPVSGKRKTIYDISMDIIEQRLQNINRNARMNRTMSESDMCIDDDETFAEANESITKSTPQLTKSSLLSDKPDTTQTISTPSKSLISNGVQSENKTSSIATISSAKKTVTKRKLFAPSSMYSISMNSINSGPVETNTRCEKQKTSSIKRHRKDEIVSESIRKKMRMDSCPIKDKPIEKPVVKIDRKLVSHHRRSTMDFQKVAPKQIIGSKQVVAKSTRKTQFLVYTNMHKEQIEIVKETIELLGGFEIENTVNHRTTHVVSLEPQRTINLLRGIARGLWILRYDWILDSRKANKWILEDFYEMRNFSNAVSICRAERQAFGSKYTLEILRGIGKFYVSSKCKCLNLKELIELCGGQITQKRIKARFIISESYKYGSPHTICVSPNWILDSIAEAKLKHIHNYAFKSIS